MKAYDAIFGLALVIASKRVLLPEREIETHRGSERERERVSERE